jgi:large repetitive protein
LPAPTSPVLTDNAPTGNSPDTNAAANIWGTLAGGDVLEFSATYTVTQDDIDLRQ